MAGCIENKNDGINVNSTTDGKEMRSRQYMYKQTAHAQHKQQDDN